MPPATPRIAPLTPGEYSEDQAALAQGRDSLNFVKVLLQHPEMYKVFIPFCEKLALRPDLPARDREVLILRTLDLCGEHYETVHHAVIARNYGLTDAEYEAARKGSGDCLTELDRLLVQAAEELFHDKRIGDATWQALSQHYSRVQLMELVYLVGNYTAVAMLSNSFGFQLEDDFHNTWKPN